MFDSPIFVDGMAMPVTESLAAITILSSAYWLMRRVQPVLICLNKVVTDSPGGVVLVVEHDGPHC